MPGSGETSAAVSIWIASASCRSAPPLRGSQTTKLLRPRCSISETVAAIPPPSSVIARWCGRTPANTVVPSATDVPGGSGSVASLSASPRSTGPSRRILKMFIEGAPMKRATKVLAGLA